MLIQAAVGSIQNSVEVGIQNQIVGMAEALPAVEIGEELVGFEFSALKGHPGPADQEHGTCQNQPSHMDERLLFRTSCLLRTLEIEREYFLGISLKIASVY